MPETAPAAGRTHRPGLAARLGLAGLPWIFLALWAGLLHLLVRTLSQLTPAALALDPAVLLLWLTLGPMTLHLAQALFYHPRKPSCPPVFLGLAESPLVFLPLAGPGRLETGPAFFVAAGPGDRDRLLAEAQARLKQSRAGRLSLLLESRSPLDLVLRALDRQPWPLAGPARLLLLLTSPMRQLIRLCGFLFFRADQAWADSSPAETLTIYKRRLAWDLWRRARALEPPTEEEDKDAQIRRLTRLRSRLIRLYHNPGYGTQFGEPWPEAETDAPENKIWLDPRYRGALANLPVTLYAKSPAWLYAPGRPEKDLSQFYPPELALEAEDAALLAAEGEFLASLLAGHPEEGLIRLDGRLRPTWDLAAELSAAEELFDRHLKRIFTHHARARAAHLAAAETLGRGWPEILREWGAVLWLAEHGRWALTRAREDFQALDPNSALPGPAEFFPFYGAVSPNSRESAEKFYAVWADLRERLADLDLPVPAGLAPPTKSNWPLWQAAWPAAWASLDQALAELRDRALTGLLNAEDQVAQGQAGPAPAVPRAPVTADFPITPDRPQPPRVYYPSTRLKVGPARSALAALILALLAWQGGVRGLGPAAIHNGPPTGAPVAAPLTAIDQAETVTNDDDAPPPDEPDLLDLVEDWPEAAPALQE
jgi:hypothetical protein